MKLPSTLKLKPQADGTMRVQGVFAMHDKNGFPMDMAYELAKDQGWSIDWVEALADAARQCVSKFKAALEEIRMLEPDQAEAIKMVFACGLMGSEGESFCDKAQALYDTMHNNN